MTLLFLALAACNKDPDSIPDPQAQVSVKLERFADCGELSDALVDSFVEQLISSRYGWRYLAEDASGGDAGSDDGGGSPDDYSTTNVQEEGVDEPDIVKTDGDYLYVVQTTRPELTIVDSWPPEEAHVVGRLPIEGYPISAFLRDDRVVVYQWVYDDRYYGYAGDSPVRDGYGLRVSFIDVSDRTNPVLERDVDLEGWMGDARLIEGDSYLVLNTWFDMPDELWELGWREDIGLPEFDYEASEEAQEAARGVARAILHPLVEEAVAAMDVEALLPRYYVNDGAWSEGQQLLECSDVYHPAGVAYPGLLALVHLDLDTPGDPTATGLFANGWTVYASLQNLYVAQSSYWWSWGYGEDALTTHLHKFALDGADSVYRASGEVEGWLLDPFSMSEHEGYLRAATTEFDWWWGTTDTDEVYGNGVYVLEESAGALNVVGSVTDLAPGEMIYSARFVGDEGWLVTFRQTDPLFSLDLSDPTSPRVTGELEIPGFSSYMHPVGDGYLLTVGMAGEDDGTLTSFAVKLFDVRDPENPIQVQELAASSDDWSYSEALWDHHAFTFHNGVLSVPLYTDSYDESTGSYEWFSGLWVIQVDTTEGLTELGRVDHADLVAASECLYDPYGGCDDDYWYAWMRRGVIMEDKLYSISDYGVKVSELYTPDDTVQSVLFWPEG